MIFNNKTIFIHYPKTGGNSIQDALREYSKDVIVRNSRGQDGIDRFGVYSFEGKNLRKHSSLQDYFNVFKKDVFNYKIFITIRNPFDRLISFYFSPHRGEQVFDKQNFLRLVNKVPTLEHYISFKECFWCKKKLFENITILRYENLQEDFIKLSKQIGAEAVELPHRNKSVRKSYKAYYDDDLIDLVKKRHNYEINLGKYTF